MVVVAYNSMGGGSVIALTARPGPMPPQIRSYYPFQCARIDYKGEISVLCASTGACVWRRYSMYTHSPRICNGPLVFVRKEKKA